MVKWLIGFLYNLGLVVRSELKQLDSVVVFGSSGVTQISLSRFYTHSQFIHCRVSTNYYRSWFITVLYGSPKEYLCSRLFSTISSLNIPISISWVLGGDFNDF